MTGGRAGRGGKEGWSFGGFLSSLPRTTCIFSFMGYGFAVLDEWVTLLSDIRPGTDFWRLLGCWGKFVQDNCALAKNQCRTFLKLWELKVLVFLRACVSQSQRLKIGGVEITNMLAYDAVCVDGVHKIFNALQVNSGQGGQRCVMHFHTEKCLLTLLGIVLIN